MVNTLHLSDRLSFLVPAFLNLEKNIVAYGELVKWKELPYFINERATLSLFSGACWQADLISLEEYVTTKYDEDTESYGRCDLYVCPKSGPDDIEFEAKQKWPTHLRKNTVEQWLLNGDKDAFRNRNAIIQASITFVVPKVDLNCDKDKFDNFVKEIVDSALEVGIDGLHFWSSEESWGHSSEARSGGSKSRWPCLITLIRIVNIDKAKRSIKKNRLPLGISVI